MAAKNFDAVNAQLARIPGYLEAVRRANKYNRGEVARQFASAHGIETPSGAVDERGRFYDPNNDNWYSDPRVLGPIAVGAAGGIGALAGGGAAAGAGGAGGLLPSSSLPVGSLMGGPAAITSQGVSGAGGLLAARHLSGPALAAATRATAPNITSQGVSRNIPIGGINPNVSRNQGDDGNGLLDWFKDPRNLLNLAPMIGALASNRGTPPAYGPSARDANSEEAPIYAGGAADTEFLKQAYAEAQRLNDMKEARFRRVDPLHQAVTQLAFNRMPTTNGTNGITLDPVALPPRRT